MLGRAAVSGFVAATYCMLTANAILLPPGVNAIDDSLLSIDTQLPSSQSTRIPCTECAFSTKEEQADSVESGDEVFRIEGGANQLLLTFEISEDGRRIELNGVPIYPPLAWSNDKSVVVHQVPAGGEDVKVPLRVTSSGLMMDAVRPDEDQTQASLITLRYSVLGLEEQLMQLQAVKIDVLKTGDHLLLIKVELDAEDKPAPPPPHHGPLGFRPHLGGPPFHGPPPGMTNEKECKMLPASVCRFRQMLEAKIDRLRHKKPCPGCMGPPRGRLPSHIRPPLPHLAAHGEHPRPQHGRPHRMGPWHGRPHGHHRHHHGNHHWTGAFMRGFIAVLIPVAAGITVGLAVSLLGLLLGRLFTWTWTKCAGRPEREAREESVEEGKGLMIAAEDDEQEALPAYEDAPTYEEYDAKVPY